MIAAAMREELKAIIRAHGFKRTGDHWLLQRGDTQWIAVQFGLGEKGVAQRLKPAIEKHLPARLIVVGFAGGLDPNLQVGDVRRVGIVAGDDPMHRDEREGDISIVDVDDRVPADVARVFTARLPVPSPEAKTTLREKTGCHLVDMESYFVAAVCDDLELPFQIHRVVSDAADEFIPNELIGCVQDNGNIDSWRAFKSLCVRPWLWATAVRLRRQSRQAAAALVEVVGKLLEQDE